MAGGGPVRGSTVRNRESTRSGAIRPPYRKGPYTSGSVRWVGRRVAAGGTPVLPRPVAAKRGRGCVTLGVARLVGCGRSRGRRQAERCPAGGRPERCRTSDARGRLRQNGEAVGPSRSAAMTENARRESGEPGTRTLKGLRPAVFKTAALPIRSSSPRPERSPSDSRGSTVGLAAGDPLHGRTSPVPNES
jgi:hypothetical protein